ncbi:MBG domain-containing protein [Secundilactobacillus hailunensis]|uniref:MBG domain-containing protein n=1 Tax=Secundilactobacillus hailunensis TaxID=2559923 RepID=A0ABW1T738_9LACO|nr:MBG domain-containing protein [Secundilactobacillus hailunensis]
MIDPDVTNVTNGHWGNQPDANDNAILYATDTPTFTQGSYKLNYGGDYTNNDQVATALGLTNAVTLKESYANTATNPYAYLWGGKFTIVHIPVKDTYNLTDVNGNQVANPVTIQGQVGDGYNALSVVPTTIKDTDGKVQYVLDPSSLVTDQTFKATPQTLDGTEKVAEGQTYTVKYKHVIDTAIAANQVQVQNQAQTWNNSKPDAYTVSVPAGYAVPETWTKNTDGTYTITTASRDIDSTAVGTAVGQYSVTLSKQGIAKLAMLNPDYLFDNKIANAGTLTITPLNIPVNVEDTAGNQLAPQQNVQLGEAKTESGVNVAVDGYPTDQLAQITFNYATTGNKGVKKATYIIDKQGNTFAEITTYTDGSQPSTLYVLAAGLGGTKAGDAVANLYNKDIDQNRNPTTSLIKFGQTPKITADQAGTFASLASVDVVYYQKATADVDYVDDDNGQGQILNSPVTINGFVGDNVTYTVAVPDGYLPVAPITDGSKMTTTLTEDGSDNLVVHLTHKHTASTVVGTRDIHFKVASNNGIGGIDDSNLPKTITQKVIWNVDKDDVTEKYTATPQNDFADIPVQPITVNTTDGTINSTTTYTPQFDTVKGITLTPLTDLDANDITALGTPVSDTFYYYAARTQVPTDAPATDNDNFYDYTQPGQTTDGIHVYSKGQVPTDAPSVTPDDYYDYTQPGEPGDGIQSRTQVPTDAPSVTTDDYYDYTQPGVPGPGIHVYTDNTQPGGTDTTTQTTDNDTTTPTTPVTTPTGDDTDTTTTTTDNNTTVPGTNPTGNTTDTTDTTTTTTDNNRVVPTKNGQVVTSTNRGTAVNGAYANATTNRAQQLGTQQLGDVTGVETGNVTGSSQGNAANAQTAKLPQTNEQNTSVWAMLGLGLMSVLSLFGLAKGKKREEDK